MSEKSNTNSRNRLSRWIWLLIGLVFLGVASYGGWYYYQRNAVDDTETTEVQEVTPPPAPIFMPLEPFTASLLSEDNGLDRVLYIGITLRLPDEEARSHMTEYLPEIRSRLLMLFSRQYAEVLADEKGKQQLINDIKKVLTPPLVPGRPNLVVNDVMFTAFILR